MESISYYNLYSIIAKALCIENNLYLYKLNLYKIYSRCFKDCLCSHYIFIIDYNLFIVYCSILINSLKINC